VRLSFAATLSDCSQVKGSNLMKAAIGVILIAVAIASAAVPGCGCRLSGGGMQARAFVLMQSKRETL